MFIQRLVLKCPQQLICPKHVNKLGDGGGEGDYKETRDTLGSNARDHCLDGGFHGCMHLSKFIKLYALNTCSLLCHLYFNKVFLIYANKKIKTNREKT